MKQWELPNNSTVVLPDGTTAIYQQMDGMFAQWLHDGELKVGNYENIELRDGVYYAVIDKTI